MPDFRVHGVGKVNGRGAFHQGNDASLWCVDVDLVEHQVRLQNLEKRQRSPVFFSLGFDHSLHPRDFARRRVFLVAPVGSHTIFGAVVHLLRANLDFHFLRPRPQDSGVKRLVLIELGRIDVVLEPTFEWSPQSVNCSQSAPTLSILLHNDPKTDQVKDGVELLTLNDHLFVD